MDKPVCADGDQQTSGFCPNCGAAASGNFCSVCGAPLAQEVQTSAKPSKGGFFNSYNPYRDLPDGVAPPDPYAPEPPEQKRRLHLGVFVLPAAIALVGLLWMLIVGLIKAM